MRWLALTILLLAGCGASAKDVEYQVLPPPPNCGHFRGRVVVVPDTSTCDGPSGPNVLGCMMPDEQRRRVCVIHIRSTPLYDIQIDQFIYNQIYQHEVGHCVCGDWHR